MSDLIPLIIGFLLGTATGAAGTYFGNKFTAQSKGKEATVNRKKIFTDLREEMPKLFDDMRTDFLSEKCEEYKNVREFYVLKNEKAMIGIQNKQRFQYYETDYDDLRGKLDRLENEQFIRDVTIGNVPIYRMNEEFVEFICNLKTFYSYLKSKL